MNAGLEFVNSSVASLALPVSFLNDEKSYSSVWPPESTPDSARQICTRFETAPSGFSQRSEMRVRPTSGAASPSGGAIGGTPEISAE